MVAATDARGGGGRAATGRLPAQEVRQGNITISDPFWLKDKDAEWPCGFFDLEVNCSSNGVPVSSIWFHRLCNHGYLLGEHNLCVVDLHKEEDMVLLSSNSCHFCHGIPQTNWHCFLRSARRT